MLMILHRVVCPLLATLLVGAAAFFEASAAAPTAQVSSLVPRAWKDFALKLRDRLQQRLAGSDEQMQHVNELFSSNVPAGFVVAKVWVGTEGVIERVEFDGLNAECAVALRAILARVTAGTNPPADMLQPVRLKLTLPQG